MSWALVNILQSKAFKNVRIRIIISLGNEIDQIMFCVCTNMSQWIPLLCIIIMYQVKVRKNNNYFRVCTV